MQYLEHGLEDLMEISKRVYQSSGVGPSEIEALFATNGSSTYLELMAEAAQMPVSRAYAEDVSRYGHVHSCDNLISLKSYAERTNCSAGRCYMLLAWSPYVVSASILRSNGYY
jgi:3-oxoacyl-[acyl-carrier-protein] synthase III